MTYHAGSLVKGDHPVDVLLRAYERHVLPRVFDRCADLIAVSPVSKAHATGRAQLVPPGVDCTVFTPPATADARDQRVLYVGRVERTSRWKGLHVLVESLVRLRETRARRPARRRRRRRRRLGAAGSAPSGSAWPTASTGTAVSPRRAAALLPAGGRDRAAVADRVRVVRDDAGRGDGQWLPGRRVGRRRHPVRDPRPGRRLARPAGRRRRPWPRPRPPCSTDPARAAALGSAGRQAAQARWDWSRQEDRTIRVLEEAARPGRRRVAA